MYSKHVHHNLIILCLFLALIFLCSCSKETDGAEASSGGTRPNTPVVYEPAAPGAETIGTSSLIIDISNRTQGYIMARYTGSSAKANIQLTGADGIVYKYFITPSDTYTALPLTAGSGSYQIILILTQMRWPPLRKWSQTLLPTWTQWQTSIIM